MEDPETHTSLSDCSEVSGVEHQTHCASLRTAAGVAVGTATVGEVEPPAHPRTIAAARRCARRLMLVSSDAIARRRATAPLDILLASSGRRGPQAPMQADGRRRSVESGALVREARFSVAPERGAEIRRSHAVGEHELPGRPRSSGLDVVVEIPHSGTELRVSGWATISPDGRRRAHMGLLARLVESLSPYVTRSSPRHPQGGACPH